MLLNRFVPFAMLALALCLSRPQAAMVEVSDADVQAGGTINWTAGNTYLLHGKIFIRSGARLNIEAGTTIYADNNSGAKATLLVVCRGARIYADGTADKPILFTSIFDTSKTLLPIGNLSRGLWGGLQILGRAHNNFPGGIGTKLQDDVTVSDSTLMLFGDSPAKDDDTSGVLRYVSVRYTGMTDKAEIKGFVLASLGKGTIVDHIEGFCQLEDGIDLYGGTVDVKHAVSAFNAGDDFFYTYGYTGRVQFLFAIQTVIPGGKSNGTLAKLESSDSSDTPFSNGIIYNGTFIGTGKSNADTWKYKYGIYYKKNAAGTLANSIVTQCSNYGIFVDTTTNPATSSRTHLGDSTLVIKNNIFFDFGKGNTVDSVAKGVATLQSHLTSHANDLSDPGINAYSWPSKADSLTLNSDHALDPRPSATGPALQNVATPPDGFFEKVSYRGAFDPQGPVWLAGWSTLSKFGLLKAEAEAPAAGIASRGLQGPGYARAEAVRDGNRFRIRWSQAMAGNTTVSLHELSGRLIGVLDAGHRASGAQAVSFSLPNPSRGMYLLRVSQPGRTETVRLAQVD